MAEFRRSRLEKQVEEQATKSTIALGLLSIGAVLAVVVFGLPLLVRLSVVLGEIKTKTSGEVKEKTLPPLPPRLVVPYEATNSAKITVAGLAEVGAVVELLKNDVAIGTTVVSTNGDFNFVAVELDNGVNSFLARARTDGGGSSELSTPLEVIYDNLAPGVEMTNPSESSLTVDYAEFDVIGKTEKGASVMVNGHIAVVDDEGKFKSRIQLVAGKNTVETVVRDLAGNETKKTVDITYDI